YNYAAGSTYSGLTTEDESTVTLFPKWLGNIYTVSFNARGGIGLYPTSMDVRYGETYGSGNYGSLPSPTPPSGYAFVGWYTSTSGGTLVTAETQMTTIGAHTLYARYAAKKQVYFKNSLGWDTVYVTFDAMWDGGQGAGNEGRTYRTMSRIAGTDIWYHDIPDSYLSGWAFNIAFNDTFQTGFHAFTAGEAVYREDFDSLATLFVPKNTDYMGEDGKGIDGNYPKNGVKYISTGYNGTSTGPKYTSGYWMKYKDYYSGYELTYQKKDAASWETGKKMKTGVAGDTTFVYTVKMDANSTYYFAFYKEIKTSNNNSRQYRYASEINSGNCTDLKLACDPNNAWMKTTVAGDYKFILTTKKDGHMYLTIEYPFAVNDYKVVYSYTKGGAQTYESEYIKARENGKDTISVFIHSGDSATSRALTIHKCTGITDGVATWNTSYASITLPSETASGKTSAVYNIAITQDESSAASGSVIEKYEGDYYIRTWCADGGWDQYKEREDNVMTYSAYSMTQTLSDPYSHYYCRFVGSTSTDITYAIATKYSPNISGIMTGDGTIGNAATTLPAAANVRFSWNSETNAMQRAYIKPAQGGDYDNSRFLVMHGAEDGMIFNPNGSAIGAAGDLAANELQFEDKGDWLYQVMLQAVPRAEVSIIAKYNNADRYLVGGATSYTKIMGGTGSDKYTIMAVYDFKTNRLMNAWTPGGEISEKLDTVDMLWIRYKQEEAQQITFTEDGSLANVTTVGAIQLDYDDLVGHVASWTYETRPLLRYFISFPFDVNVSDIFGLHGAELGRDFVIRKYDGAERAKNGLFLGDGDTYWVDLTMDSVMHANEGYSLVFDNEYLNGDLGSIWENKTGGSSVYLYFPAADKIASISDANKTTTLAQHLCEDARTYISGGVSISHANSDSHWNLIGSPLFVNSYVYSSTGTNGQTGVAEKRTLDSYYAYDAEWNRWIPTLYYNDSRKEYYACKAMHAMLVQFAGSVEWSKTAPTPPSSVAARERKETTVTNRLITLNLMQNGEKGDHTYIKMDENGYSDFMLCEDLYKIIYKNKPMLFSYAGQNCVAYNKVAIESQTINLGIEIRQNDTYTFTMPENVAGQVTLVDHFAQTRTNLNIEDYEVYLNKGNYYDRFAIEIKVNEAPTAIDGVQDGSGSLKDGKAHKFIMDDQMYILKDGVIYDARGNRVR
ncbi:MAG: InlB B-repeat-containing protein, partial [Paludibacteraceae bacterium]|nr:InlB B-repeat-containing protein [Paludibacteraceae bacterium]